MQTHKIPGKTLFLSAGVVCLVAICVILSDHMAKNDSMEQLVRAVTESNEERVGQLLSTPGIDINCLHNGELTLLHYAVVQGDIDIVRMLLDAGADVNRTGATGSTPLDIAFIHGKEECARLLTERGGNIDLGKNIIAASKAGNANLVRFLLEQRADANEKDSDGNSVLLLSSVVRDRKDRGDVVECLLSWGADANARQAYTERTALHAAAWRGSITMAKALVNHKADVNARDLDGNTPLHFATKNGHNDIVRYLLNSGANRNLVNDRGMTALEEAQEAGMDGVIKMLSEGR